MKITIRLTQAEIAEAVRLYLSGKGVTIEERADVAFGTEKADRPGESDSFFCCVTGVHVRAGDPQR